MGKVNRKKDSPLGQFLSLFAETFLEGQRERPSFATQVYGKEVELRLDVGGEQRVVRQRASALWLLAGHFWAMARVDPAEHGLTCLVPTLTSYPLGWSNAWDKWDSFRVQSFHLVAAFADAIPDEDEKTLLIRHALEPDDFLHPELVKHVPEPIREACIHERPVLELAEEKTSLTAHIKVLLPAALSGDELDRLAVAKRFVNITRELRNNNHLTFAKTIEPALTAWLDERDGAVYETAVGITEMLAHRLFNRRAYPEAVTWLTKVIDAEIASAETFRARWASRLALGDPHAEQDWARSEPIDDPSGGLAEGFFYRGDREDRRARGLGLVAEALVHGSRGEDPCKDRRKKKRPVTDDDAAELLDRAQRLVDEALEITLERSQADIKRVKKSRGKGESSRGFQSHVLAAQGVVAEARGQLPTALEAFEKARDIATAGGLGWQTDFYGEDIRRVRAALSAPEDGIPQSFDTRWFLDMGRTEQERSAACERWTAQKWREFPKTKKDACAIPLAYVLLRSLVKKSDELWKQAKKDRAKLPDRLALCSAARAVLDRFEDRPDASSLWSLYDKEYDTALYVAFDDTHRGGIDKRTPLWRYIRALDADEIEQRSVTDALPAQSWKRLKAFFDRYVNTLNPYRDLFDAAVAASADTDAIAALLHAYLEMPTNDRGLPKPKWHKLAKPMTSADPKELAPRIVAWTRAQQKVKGLWGYTRLPAKHLWPFFYVWDPATEELLLEVLKGDLDNGKRLSKTQRAARLECLEWLAQDKGCKELTAALARRRR